MSNLLVQIKQAEAAKKKALAALHTELGFESAHALANAILDAAAKSTRTTPTAAAPAQPKATKAGAKAAKAAKAAKGKGKGKGRRLPAEVRQGIVDALNQGRKGAHVAREFGVSYPTVHFIKQDLGLVQARGKASKQKRAK